MASDISLPNFEVVEDPISLTVTHSGQSHTLSFSNGAILDDLVTKCEEELPEGFTYDWDKAKFLAKQRQWKASDLTHRQSELSELNGAKVKLLVPKISDVDQLQAAAETAKARAAASKAALAQRRAVKLGTSTRARAKADAQYTFLRVEPLPHLPNPEQSRKFLHRLKEDRGIRAAMAKHKFTVGLLTEMNPIEYTQESHEGTTRVLGLNRNHGEVIELRLRTDAYDGYRDYKTIRNTLCHELAHNVHGPHDRKFWDLCHQIEREVQAVDGGGHTIGHEEFYEPSNSEEDVPDHGGWTGGSYTLGGTSTGAQGMSRREIMARAAEDRARQSRQSQTSDDGDGEGNGGSL